MANLAAKYRPATFDDVTEQKVVVDIVRNICESKSLSNRNFLFTGSAGCGKAQPLYSKVLTPDGFIEMRDVNIGTIVYTAKGNIAKVIGIYPQGVRQIYEITLDNGQSIRVSDNHLNVFYIHNPQEDADMSYCWPTNELVDFMYHHDVDIYVEWPKVPGCTPEDHDRKIVSIQPVSREECQCIMLDHEDHTYVSDNFIPTHNTTLGRIIANELNEHKGGIIELDAASHSGVDDMRQLIEQAKQYPVGTNYKVFIVDECHALSPNAWQSALKTIEEQPAKSIFIWCTTNPEKIPETIISRVQTFQLSKISLNGIYNRLKYIIEKENASGAGITYEEDALLYIAKLAQGGMRDAITLLDKSLAYTKNISSQALNEALGLPNYDDYFALLNAIARKDNATIIEIVGKTYNSGVNFVKWFEGFFGFITNIVKYIYTQDITTTMIPTTYKEKLSAYTIKHASFCLKLSNQLTKLNHELKTSQYLQELAIAYLCKPGGSQ